MTEKLRQPKFGHDFTRNDGRLLLTSDHLIVDLASFLLYYLHKMVRHGHNHVLDLPDVALVHGIQDRFLENFDRVILLEVRVNSEKVSTY